VTSESIGEALLQLLLATPELTALVGDRIYPGEVPQKPERPNPLYPCIVYHEISGDSLKHLSGVTGFADSRLQFDCHGLRSHEASQVRQVLRLKLQPYRGMAGPLFISNVEVDTGGRRDEYVPPIDGSDDGRYIKQIDFMVQHSEPAVLGA
jgi:hypothetical protein